MIFIVTREIPSFAENDEYTTLPNGLNSLIQYGNMAPRIPQAERDRFFENIADAQRIKDALYDDAAIGLDKGVQEKLLEAEENRHHIMRSYMSLVISRAYNALRLPGSTRLEDYIHSGIEGLYESIDAYATSDKRQQYAFTSLARTYIDQAISKQRLRDIYSTEIGRTILNAVYAFRAAERDAERTGTAKVDIETFAKENQLSRQTLQGALAAVATYRRGWELPENNSETGREPYEISAYAHTGLSPHLQASLLLLSPMQRKVIVRFYGLSDEATLQLDDLAELHGISEPTVRRHKDTAISKLRDILTHIDDHGLDFARWPEKGAVYFRQNLSVLTYLFRAGLDIPLDRTVQDHCSYAMKDLSRRNIPDLHKQMIADMYGLHNAERLTIAKLMEKYGRSSAYFSQIAKNAMSK